MKVSDHQAAPSASAIPTTASMRQMALDELTPSPANPRRIDENDPKLVELADSLRTLGQIEPIVVRRVASVRWKDGDEDGKPHDFIILAGERRWRAARLAGLTSIECKVIECDDRTALEITVVENLQRQDLHPLDEARGVRSLLDGGWDVAEIAAHLGKSATWVALRAKLSELAPSWTTAIAKGKMAWAKVAHLEQIARMPAAVQDELAKDYEDEWDSPSVSELASRIQTTYLHHLSSAPWKQDDADLVPAAGPCAGCCKRSDLQQVLFGDLAGKARCLDAVCWASKTQAHTARTVAALQAKSQPVVVISGRGEHVTPPPTLPADVRVIESYGVNEVKKSTPGAIAAVHADTGKQVWVTAASYAPKETCAALGKPVKAPASGPGSGKGSDSAAVKMRQRQAKRIAWRFEQVIDAMGDTDRPEDGKLLRLVALLVVGRGRPREAETWEAIASRKRTLADDQDDLWNAVTQYLDAHIGGQVVSTQLPDIEAVQAVEELMDLKPTEQAEKALQQVPEPATKAAKVAPGQKPGSGKVGKAKATKPAKAKTAKASKGKRGAA
jgi:ParB/RepB/Spo0J family partition protein